MTDIETNSDAQNLPPSSVSEQIPGDPRGQNHDVVEPENALPEITLRELPEQLQQAAANAGWTSLMPVQAKAVPYMLAGRDLMVQSRTGSGKTGAFILPILNRIKTNKASCQALVLVPTRELANQVAKEAGILGAATGVRSVAVYGGVSYGPQLKAMQEGAHLVIGTPGRILDHLLRRNLRLDDLEILVFDEADRMLSMGFYPDMREVQRYLPRRRINAYMFSATFPAHVMRLAHQFLTDPDFLSLSRDRVHVADAEHVYYLTPPMQRDRSLVRLIEIENPGSAIIFCNTKNTVHYVTVVLQRFGYDADELSSDLGQQAREKVLGRVRDGHLRFLVATDVAARGIDIPELTHVFLYEPPEDIESYIHRAGRTARAGAPGVAISMVENVNERMQLDRIAKRYGIAMEERQLPEEGDVAALVSERVTTLLEAKLRTRDKLQTERMQRFSPLIAEWMESGTGQSLMTMLVDDFYQASLHAPLETGDDGQTPQRGERVATQSQGRNRRRRRGRRKKSGQGA
ncbi:MAG: DEAD/DEAH box helicase [Caldilineales bacterium]|nr:DEAD/DEAH box helicase [Caldilineales bacterium]